MTDRFDEAKRALEGVPAPDVWAEAERRASDNTVVPLAAVGGGGGRRPGRWLAAAAAAALLVAGTVAVLADDGEDPVDTAPSSTSGDPSIEEDVTTYQAPGACKLGIRGEPLREPATVSSTADLFVAGSIGTLVEGSLNATQTYAVHVPGQVVIDLVGERVEDVQLGRGTAQLWFHDEVAEPASLRPVQVRWFTGSQDACESFTVTVAGGTEDENRHAAVDLAERVLMPDELPDDPSPGGNPLANTEWLLERSIVGGDPTQGDGSEFSFGEDTVGWTDGCNSMSASYTYADDTLTLDAMVGTAVGCAPNATSDAINAVMTAGPVEVTFDGILLVLRGGDGELVLRSIDLYAGDPGSAKDPKTDGLDAGEVTTTTMLEPSTTTTVVGIGVDLMSRNGLFELGDVATQLQGDQLTLTAGDRQLVGQRA